MGGPQLEDPLLVETDGAVAVLTLNRPAALNALNHAVMERLASELDRLEKDDAVRAVVLTGGPRAFAAGADIKEMEGASESAMRKDPHLSRWDRVARFPKPMIAAVSGFALGGGFELALACDLIVASETAQFGQPEILIGVIPGAGGTVRLAQALGKARALELVWTGRRLPAREAHAAGLVARLAPPESVLDEAKRLARELAALPPLAARAAKAAVLKAADASTEEALAFERDRFHSLFSTEDQKEGMKAFVEKRRPSWKGR